LQQDREESVFAESDYFMRFRYRLQLRVPLSYDDAGNERVNFRMGDEIMLNHRGNAYDQNRIYANVEYVFNRNFSVEGGYMFIDQRRMRRDEYVSTNVVRFSFFHRLYLRSKG